MIRSPLAPEEAKGNASVAPRPVFCITKDVHNDRAVADAVSQGRFLHQGTALDLGTRPDWLGAHLPSDEEWRIEWTKFYYGLDLAGAFCDTGNSRYLTAWEDLVESWIDQAEAGSDSADVAARRMQNWTYAWGMFAAAPAFRGLRQGLERVILDSLRAHVRTVRDRLTPDPWRNHRTLELYALFVVALAFPQLDRTQFLLDFTIAELHRTLADGFRRDGVHRESSTHYHMIVLRSLVGMRENARRFALDLPDDFDIMLERACDFALHSQRPDGVIASLSDGDSASFPEVLRRAASLLDRPDFCYSSTSGAEGTSPVLRNASFGAGGYYVQRSGWGECRPYADERFLVFDCGPLGEGGHGHYDLLSVEGYANGRPLVVDPGRGTYSEEGTTNFRRWFKGTAAHNTVTVDGLDQTPYRRGRPGAKVAAGTFLGRSSVPGLDVLKGRAESPSYDALHTRRILFVADDYWIFEDRVESSQQHHYDLRWHLMPKALDATEILVTDGTPIVVAPGVALVCDGGSTVRIENGWVAPSYGMRLPAPVVKVTACARDVRFITLLAPLAPGRPAPTLRITADRRDSTVVEVTGPGPDGATDIVGWNDGREHMLIGPARCIASAAWLRVIDGSARAFRAINASKVELPAGRALNTAPDGGIVWDEGTDA
jgi:uncharacterized heparinase superfamily protein